MRLFAAALLLPVIAGCSGDEGAQCAGDQECAEGLVCFAGACAPLGRPAGSITLYISPTAESGFVPAAFALDGNQAELELCRGSEIRGTVAAEGETRLLAEGSLAGMDRTMGYEEAVDGPFTLRLPAGTWRLTFELPAGDDDLAPPPIVREVELGACEGIDLEPVEPPAELRTLTVLPVVDEERDPRPRCGVAVSFADAVSGEALAQPLAIGSGESCTAPAEGWTVAFAEPPSARLAVRLAPLDTRRPTFATRTIVIDVTGQGPLELGRIGVGESPLERVLVRVEDPEGAPVRGAAVRAATLPGETEFQAGAALELEPGLYELWVVPGSYRVEVIPPASSALALTRCVSSVDEPCGGELAIDGPVELVARLSPLLQLGGRVSDATGPVVEARVTAIPARGGGGREVSTLTGSRGRYTLRLDPGEYDLVVLPHDGARATLRLPLPAPLAADGIQNLLLPPPARIVGHAWGTEGDVFTPLDRALVRAYRVREGAAPAVVGEAATDESGRFTLVLPGE